MTVYLVISLPKILFIHRKYMVLANLVNMCTQNEHDEGGLDALNVLHCTQRKENLAGLPGAHTLS